MPTGGRRKPLNDELRLGRQAFYARLAGDAHSVAQRLEAAYQGRLPEIDRAIRDWERDQRRGGVGPRGLETLKERIETELEDLSSEVALVSEGLQRDGAEQGVRAGLAALRRGGVNATFHLPTVETIAAGIRYVDSPAWRAAVNGLGGFHAQQAADVVLTAIALGQNPRETARQLREYFTTSKRPLADALRMARTTQLYAAREGTRQIYERHGVSEWIWSANLGNPRTCLSCVVLHGTVHPVSEILNDHHAGRCAPIPVTPRWRDLGFSGGQDVEVETGIDWFMRQDAERQAALMGPKYFEAWQNGEFRLEDVPRQYQNAVFGPMWRKATLGELRRGGGSHWGGTLGGLPPVGPIQPIDDRPLMPWDIEALENQLSLQLAKDLTPDVLEKGAEGPLAEYMYNFFAYDNQANPTFDARLVENTKDDLFYATWSLGKGHLDMSFVQDIRQKAAGLLAADEYLGKTVFTRKERNLLTKMASEDDDIVRAAIDSTRDRRLKGRLAYRGAPTRARSDFISAAGEDGRQRLLEMNKPWWVQKRGSW